MFERTEASIDDSMKSAELSFHDKVAILLGTTASLSSFVGGVFVPSMRSLLVSIGVGGLFLTALATIILLDHLVPIGVATSIASARSSNVRTLSERFDTEPNWMYVPVVTDEANGLSVRLVASSDERQPETQPEAENETLELRPVGEILIENFDDEFATENPELDDLTVYLEEMITQVFRLATDVSIDIDAESGEAIVFVDGCAPVDSNEFDVPIVSVVAVVMVTALGQPIQPDIKTNEENSNCIVTVRWKSHVDRQDSPLTPNSQL